MATGDLRLSSLLTAVAVTILIETVAWQMARADLLSPLIAIALARLLEILSLTALIAVQEGSLARIGLQRNRWKAGLTAGLYWSTVGAGLAAVTGAVLLSAGINPLQLMAGPVNRPTLLALTGLYLTGAFISPVAEEIFFRGLIYGYFRRWGVGPALFISTAVFALLHLPSHPFPIQQIIGGLAFALVYEKEKNLLAPMVVHILGNSAIFTLGIMG